MSKNQVMWIIKNSSGQLKGPYDTPTILRHIKDGLYSGTELISQYPHGTWTQISREPEFYDKLIEALEGAIQRQSPPKTSKAQYEETIFMPVPPSVAAKKPTTSSTAQPSSTPISVSSAETASKMSANQGMNTQTGATAKSMTIELLKTSSMGREQLIKAIRMPAIVITIILIVIAIIFFSSTNNEQEKISLILPSKHGTALSEKQFRDRYSLALAEISKDTVESYLEAQNKLVALIEGSPRNLEARALLCLVYKELWPFARQDSKDERVISSFTQSTKALNLTSPYGNLCEVVKLSTAGHYREARGAVESLLETSEPFSLLSVLYVLKGEILESEKDFINAAPYYERAAQLWDSWLKSTTRFAFVLQANDENAKAAEAFKRVLKINPKHKVAKIGLGLLEYRGFKQAENAYSLLSSAVEARGRVPRALEADAFFVLAELSIYRGERNRALEFAEKSYSLNPNSEAARRLVVRLGGSDKAKTDKNQNSELVFVGDQYVRQGDCLSAQAEYKAAYEIDPKNATAALKAAKCLWRLNQSYESIEWLNKAIKSDAKFISAYVLKADYLSQRYDFDNAADTLAAANRLGPGNYEVLRGMALLEFRKNNMPGAINFAMRAMKVYNGDIDTFILLAKANSALAVATVATTPKEATKKEEASKNAIRYATRAIEIDATNTEAQIAYARVLAATSGVDSGIDYLDAQIKKYSYSIEYRIALAELYKSEERYSQAKDIYEQVITVDSRNKKALLGAGECYKVLGIIDRSLKTFLAAAVVDPTDAEALFQAGRLYLETNRFDEAIQQFKRVQSINPKYPRTQYYIGRAALAAGDFDSALNATKEEKRQNPNLADSYILAAEIYDAKKQFGDCAGEYSQAMKRRPQGVEIYVKAAACYRKSGSLDVADDMLALAMARENGYAEIYKEQGVILQIRGDYRGAIKAYRLYLELSPNSADRKEIESAIAKIGG